MDGGVAKNDFILQLISNLTGDILNSLLCCYEQERDRQKMRDQDRVWGRSRDRVGDIGRDKEKERERKKYLHI